MTTNRRPDLLDRAWRIAGTPRVTLALLALTGVMLAVALIFPQQPPGLDRVAAESWLAETAARYGSLGVVLRTVGIFVALDGWILRVAAALLAFNLLLRLAAAVGQAAQVWRSRPAGARRPFAAFGWPLAWLGLLIALLGLWVNDVAGWRTADVALAPGSMTPPAASSRGLQLRLEGVSAAERDAASAVTLVMPDGAGQQINTGPRWPGRWGNLWLFQRATGPALAVTARDSAGQTLALQTLGTGSEAGSAIHLLFRQNQTEQGFGLPARNLTFRAVSYEALPEKGIGRPVFLVEAYRGDAATPVLSQLIEDDAAVTVDDATLTLRRDHYVLIGMAYLPGLPVVVVGALLALAGALAALTSSRLSPTM
jgi:hypothetical protein